jgi:tight adherence protein E
MTTLLQKLKDDRGMTSLEFAFIFPVFMLLFFMIYEVNRYVFISATIDLTLSEAARETSRAARDNVINYQDLLQKKVAQQGYLWRLFIEPEKLTVSVTFCSSLKQAINQRCSQNVSEKMPLAIYQANYQYRPLLFTLNIPAVGKLIKILGSGLNRKLIYIQEWQIYD